jgi:hypothetical protein
MQREMFKWLDDWWILEFKKWTRLGDIPPWNVPRNVPAGIDRYSRSDPNTTKRSPFYAHNNFSTTTLINLY